MLTTEPSWEFLQTHFLQNLLNLSLYAFCLCLSCSLCDVLVFLFLSFCYFCGPLQRHMEVPRLGVQSEREPPAYTTATATQDPSRICKLHHSSWQCQVINPLSGSRDQTHNPMVLSQIPFHCAMMGTHFTLKTHNPELLSKSLKGTCPHLLALDARPHRAPCGLPTQVQVQGNET